MSACLGLFCPLSDMGKRVLDTAVLVLAAVFAVVVMIKILPQTPPSSLLVPVGMYQFGGGVINVMALLYFASGRAMGEWECSNRLLLALLSAMAVSTWVMVCAVPVVLSWFIWDDLWSCAGGFLIAHITLCVLPAIVYIPFFIRGVDAAEKRKQAEHVASAPVQ